jgi:glycosyltransferase involved in cell wall biosynthesis
MRISVIVPVYNHARYIDACLRSIDQQQWADLEIIVIDDGSKDDSWRHIEDFRFMPNRRVVRLATPNRGAAVALNHGLSLATGELLTICNSDDFFLPGRLQALADALVKHPRSDFAFSQVRYFDRDDRDVSIELPYARELTAKQAAIASFPTVGFSLVLTNVAISTGNFLFRRRLLAQVGSFRPYKLVHDWDFILRCLLRTEPVYVPRPLYGYRLHAENSFTELMSTVAATECPELMRRFLKAACGQSTANPLCPSPRNWPHFFDTFIAEHRYEPYMAQWDQVDEPFYSGEERSSSAPRAALTHPQGSV